MLRPTLLLSAVLAMPLAAQGLPTGLVERAITIPGPVPLPGVVTLPAGAGPFPAVLIVHGSGAGDRDLTIGPDKPYRDIAWGLAQQRIVEHFQFGAVGPASIDHAKDHWRPSQQQSATRIAAIGEGNDATSRSRQPCQGKWPYSAARANASKYFVNEVTEYLTFLEVPKLRGRCSRRVTSTTRSLCFQSNHHTLNLTSSILLSILAGDLFKPIKHHNNNFFRGYSFSDSVSIRKEIAFTRIFCILWNIF